MKPNELPFYDASDNPTACCPRFHPEGWDRQELRFEGKLFVRARTRSLLYVPLNMGPVFRRTFGAIEAAGANAGGEEFIVLSRDLSPWASEHFFSVAKEVPGQDMVRISGDFLTRVFEGAYRNAPRWAGELAAFAAERGRGVERTFFFYTACPRCARRYGKNFVVGVAQLR